MSVLSLLLSGPAYAGGLEDLLDRAAAADPSVTIADAQADASAARVGQARAGLLPRVSATAGYTRNEVAAEVNLPGQDPVIITPLDQLEATARLDLPLVDLGAWGSLSAAADCRDSARATALASREGALLAVVQAAWDLRTATLAREAALDAVAASEAVLARAQARLEAGTSSRTDLLRATADLAQAQGTQASAEADLSAARRALAARTGVDALPADLEARAVPAGNLDDSALQRPELVAARATLDCQHQTRRSQQLDAAPTITGFFQERATNATGFQGQSTVWATGAQLSWAPVTGGLRASQVSEAAAQQRVAEASLAQLEQQARDDLANARARLTAAEQGLRAARARKEAATAAADDARARYEAGTGGTVEVSLAVSEAFDATVALARAEAAGAVAVESLRVAAGQSLLTPGGAP